MEQNEQNEQNEAASWSTQKKVKVGTAAVLIVYALIALFFHFHFFPGTKINGYSCGFRSVERVKEMIQDGVDEYSITILERDNRQETITSSQVGLFYVDDGRLEKMKEGQKPYAWILFPFIDKNYENGVTLEVDATSYENTFNAMEAFDKNRVVAPKDAWSRYNKETNSYDIIEEIYGNTVKRDEFHTLLEEAILRQDSTIDIEAIGCYENPSYKKDSEEILSSNEILNQYVSTNIVYDFDDRTQKLTGKKINKWLKVTKKFKVKIEKEKVEKYVARLAEKYDTVGIERNFTSIAGNEVYVKGGTYGWTIDQEAETAKLIRQIKKGKQVTREPEYAHYAKSRKENDIGDTYVEVDLGSQHMWFYKDGEILVSTPVVTGDTSLGRGTPTGVYYILYKTTDYSLRGDDYVTPVDYWLPFTHSGVGIHDSSWRNSYGGSIYTYDGSHGCVNTPYNAVRTIYNNIESTYPVVVHW